MCGTWEPAMAFQENGLGGFDLKTWMVFSLCAVFVILVGLFLNSEAKEKKPPTEESVAVPGPAKVMGVDEYMTNVDRYQGPVNIRGVVSAVSPKHQMLGLIDTGEFESCKVVTCAKLTLPVFWTGQMPQVKETVVVEGEAKKKNKRLVFIARTLKQAHATQKGLK